MGCECLGCPTAAMGQKSRARRVIWTPAEPNLGLALKRREPESVAATDTQKSTSQVQT